MTYTPDPDDVAKPIDSLIAETATAEFRALKTKINGIIGNWNSGAPALTLAGVKATADGYNTTLTASIAAVNASLIAYMASNTAALAAYAPIDSPVFINLPRAPTAAVGTNTAQIATTAFVTIGIAAALVNTVLTGIPTAPTAAFGSSGNQVATLDFVAATAFSSALPVVNPSTKGKFVTNDGLSSFWGAGSVILINGAASLTTYISCEVDTTAGSFTCTLPTTGLNDGDSLNIFDQTGSWGINAFGVDPGANKVDGTTGIFWFNVPGSNVTLRWRAATSNWELY